MKIYNIRLFFLSILFFSCFTSCDSYLDKEEDLPMSFPKIWEKRETIERALSNVWGYMTSPDNMVDGHPFIGASDEGSATYNRGYRLMNFGTWNPSSIPYLKWDQYYRGIREATIFMQNAPEAHAKDLEAIEREQWPIEARFARAYYYYQLVQLYGPVMILGDEILDFNLPIADLQRPRNSMDECVEYIVTELRECEKILPEEQPAQYYGKPTKGACKAIISELLLFYARPLFNGNELYADLKNEDGNELFPGIAAVKSDRWKRAADAAKEIIDMQKYELHKVQTNGKHDPLKSYQRVFLELWNGEIIWGRYLGGYYTRVHTTPRVAGGVAYGGVSPTQQQVDAYSMKNGRYPVIGYQSDGSPIIDETSGYNEDGFTNFEHPIDKGGTKRTFNMYKDREPRFYATVLWSGSKLPYTGSSAIVNFGFNGNSGGGVSHDYPKPGYMMRKWTDPTLNTAGGQWGNITWPIFRYAEVLLNYVEALNEYDPGHTDIIKYLNEIRERAGVPNIEEVYPEAIGNKNKMRELIRRERQIELAFENKRFFDTRTWMISEEVDGGPMWGMDTTSAAPSPNATTTPESFWKRTIFETRVFETKHYLYPFHQRELDRNKLIIQNYGW
ncbi:MAG: RagB/SusD family nutrient uptake outer membrane protein [Tissierellia bacterium]|nr:RagB/SusD family nutrient uptake outer membrane protein [Tissierellia bacterium]